MKFLKCKHCGNIIEVINERNPHIICCGEEMAELIPGTVEAAHEKHIPVVEINGSEVFVKVGEVTHPMTEAHLIEWIVIETNKGSHRAHLKANEAPEAKFVLIEGEEVKKAYAYCNLHGLWAK